MKHKLKEIHKSMKIRVIFKDGCEEIYDRAVINWEKRVIEIFYENKKGISFIPFEAIFSFLKKKNKSSQ